MNKLAEAAAAYMSAGLHVLALKGKVPDTDQHPRGIYSAYFGTVDGPEDEELLEDAFGRPGITGVAIVIPEGLAVVDVDGEEGAVQFMNIVDGVFPDTATATTGRGLHIWYVCMDAPKNAKLGPKLDLKSVGGYVVAPPSMHFDAETGEHDADYEWIRPLVGVNGLKELDFLPDELEAYLKERNDDLAAIKRDRKVYMRQELSIVDHKISISSTIVPSDVSHLANWLGGVKAGNRNNSLAWAAMTARDDGVPYEDAFKALMAAAMTAGLTEQESKTTIRAAYRRARDK